MPRPSRDRSPRSLLVAAPAFAVLVIGGNALQGSTPPLHGDAAAVVAYFSGAPTRIASAMLLSLLSVFALAWFLPVVVRVLEDLEAPGASWSRMASLGGTATVALLASGFALHSAGALRAGAAAPLPPEVAVVFYDGSLALTGLAAPLAMAVLLAATAAVGLRSGGLPRWFARASAVLAALGLVTPVSFVLFLLFPLWVLTAGVLLGRRPAAAERGTPVH